MDIEIEQTAAAIFRTNPFTVDGETLDWDRVVREHPDKAIEYREAAHNRIRAAEAMKQLDQPR